MVVRFTSDWLGTQPYFYHEKSGAGSTCLHDVIDYRTLEIDPDGLTDYLEFGYCAFGRTPVRHVRFVPPCARLLAAASGELREESLPDPVDAWQGRATRTDEALERTRAEVQRLESAATGQLVLPLSGGLDSRLIAALVRDRTRLRAFSYGVSPHQDDSREVTRARLVAERLGIPWQQVRLGDYLGRIAAWDDIFGVSAHAHGMYHMEFYERILTQTGPGCTLLSGLVGDAWAGSIAPIPARSAADLPALGLTRGQHAAIDSCRLRGDGRYRAEFWEQRRARFQDPVFQIVEVIRQKMMLLAFALSIPRRLGFLPEGPFLTPEVALSMVTLPAQQRQNRRWQREFFAREKLAVEADAGGSRVNYLDLHTLRTRPPEPLDVAVLRELFLPRYIEEINRRVFAPSFVARGWSLLQGHPFGVKLAARVSLPNPHSSAYAAYLTLKPLESLLRRRNAA